MSEEDRIPPDSFEYGGWQDEICGFLSQSRSACLAIFAGDGTLRFANPAMRELFRGEPAGSIINPPFASLWQRPCIAGSLIYEGFITIGDYQSANPSLRSRVFRKEDRLLICCEHDAAQLLELNQSLADLNQQINNLHRQLIREKACLQQTLTELHAANTKLAELNATKDRFFSIIAHDLRNPFNTIVGLSSLLSDQAENKDCEGVAEYAGMIEEASQRALALLLNLLEWARSQTGGIRFVPTAFPMKKLLADGVELIGQAARQKNITVGFEAPEAGMIYGDAAMLGTVLRNLLSNAVKFSHPGGHVLVTAKTDEQGWTVAVSDDGVGITPEQQVRLFRIDQNYSTTGTGNEHGTGLGLILCKEFIARHGGELRMESKPGQGSIFTFTIPHKAE